MWGNKGYINILLYGVGEVAETIIGIIDFIDAKNYYDEAILLLREYIKLSALPCIIKQASIHKGP